MSTTTTTSTTTSTWRRLTATVIGAGAIAIGGMAMFAPAANAQPVDSGSESAAHKECREAGGDYSSSTSGGKTTESCCFQSIFSGVTHCDVWVNGEWNDGLSFHEEPTATPPKPGGPPKVGGLPQRSPDTQSSPKSTIPRHAPVAKN